VRCWALLGTDLCGCQAVRFRDVELAVRLVRGGVECDPGGANWCLLVSLAVAEKEVHRRA